MRPRIAVSSMRLLPLISTDAILPSAACSEGAGHASIQPIATTRMRNGVCQRRVNGPHPPGLGSQGDLRARQGRRREEWASPDENSLKKRRNYMDRPFQFKE